ncbi:MAG TPA: DUF454 domain-containing protein [Gammaproteobacteria bacterium]|nr:DUF454 domain-containing protein [Gammaproteobacteria bacterium]
MWQNEKDDAKNSVLNPVEPRDYSHEVEFHRSTSFRVFLVLLGTGFVVLGVVGVFLPILPTTPFMLLAAWCYARSSRRFYNWIMNNRVFGPIIREWRQYRSIPRRAKRTALILMPSTFAISIVFFVPIFWVQLMLAVLCVVMFYYMWRIPVRDVNAGIEGNNS